MIRVDREAHARALLALIADAKRLMVEPRQLLIFPEGTRTSTHPVNSFKPGITLIAKLAQVPIQTVLIRSESPFLRKGWPLLRAPTQMVRIRVTLGQRFQASDNIFARIRLRRKCN